MDRLDSRESTPVVEIDAAGTASDWLARLEHRLTVPDGEALAELFFANGWWRDLLSLTWDFKNFLGAAAIGPALAEYAGAGPTNFVLSTSMPPSVTERGETAEVTAIFSFDTDRGRGRGLLRLIRSDPAAEWKGLSLLTQLDTLAGVEEPVGPKRPLGTEHGGVPDRLLWHQRRGEAVEFENGDPAVLVIGAGQTGLAVSARLGQLGIATLVVDRNQRIGDNWRDRYPFLTLHDPVGMDHMPYLPFPPTWPTFTPKEKFADWLEFYAAAMELNVWLETQVLECTYDEDALEWTVILQRADRSKRTLHPRHVIVATGLNGGPKVPETPGVESFEGTVVHSSAFKDAAEWRGRKTVVVGAGVSGHDIAQALWEAGAEVTMVQRSSTYVVRSDTWYSVFLPFYLEGGPATEDADLIAASVPFGLAPSLSVEPTKVAAEIDRDLLDRLRKVGFALDFGPDGQGLIAKHLLGVEGYYIDVGASELIADGKIAVEQGRGVRGFEPGAIVLDDGAALEADLVVFATGYEGVAESVRSFLGDEVLAKVGRIYGVGADGEMNAVWRQCGQRGLWFMVGQLQAGRVYSKLLALQIKAIEEGVMDWRADDIASKSAA